jgi:hypothetical protein
MAFNCSAPGIGSQALDFVLDTNAPAKMYVGKSIAPKLFVKVTIPSLVIQLAESPLVNVTQADATGKVTVGVNGKAVVANVTYPRTQLPSPARDFPVNLPVTLPKLTPTSAGTIRYTPGPLTATLNGYDAEGTNKGSVTANCTVKDTGKVIDTIKVIKSPTKINGSAAYGKAKERVVDSVKLTATSGIMPTGSITVRLFRNGHKLRSATIPLVVGQASKVFNGVHKPGAYKVVTTYAGSRALLSSSKSKSFRIH